MAGPLARATCLWQDLDGLHVSGPPAEAPPTSIVWGWRADGWRIGQPVGPIRNAFRRSSTGPSFSKELDERGYRLAQADGADVLKSHAKAEEERSHGGKPDFTPHR